MLKTTYWLCQIHDKFTHQLSAMTHDSWPWVIQDTEYSSPPRRLYKDEVIYVDKKGNRDLPGPLNWVRSRKIEHLKHWDESFHRNAVSEFIRSFLRVSPFQFQSAKYQCPLKGITAPWWCSQQSRIHFLESNAMNYSCTVNSLRERVLEPSSFRVCATVWWERTDDANWGDGTVSKMWKYRSSFVRRAPAFKMSTVQSFDCQNDFFKFLSHIKHLRHVL